MYRFLIFTLFIVNTPLYAWGPLGHRITAKIAESYLDKNTKVKVQKILGGETMPMVCNHPDFIKSDPEMRKKYSEYHYLSFDKGESLKNGKKHQKKNILSGIEYFTSILQNKKSNKQDKIFALSFIIHLIADLHQPLHLGYMSDRGGNSYKVSWFQTDSNLHDIWDSRLIQISELSFTEYASELLIKMTDKNKTDWTAKLDIETWAKESRNYVEKVYDFKVKEYWEFHYFYKHRSFLEQRLMQGGVRLASYLNQILK